MSEVPDTILPEWVVIQGNSFSATFIGLDDQGGEAYLLESFKESFEAYARYEIDTVVVEFEGSEWLLDGGELLHRGRVPVP